MRIFLVRHGESEANVDKTIGTRKPDHAIELTERGLSQAAAVGLFLRKYHEEHGPAGTRIWASPYKRTMQTALAIRDAVDVAPYAMGRPEVHEHIALVEQQFGLFDGIPDDELAVRFPEEHAHYKKHESFEGRFWARMPLGESRLDVALRVHQAFGTFQRDAERHGMDNLVVVCHGVVVRAFVMMWCHKGWRWLESEPNPKNCSVRLIEDGEDRGYLYEGS